MKQKEFCAELLSAGCRIIRHGASHDIWYSPITGRKWALPRHVSHELAVGTEKKARKVLGV